jgi:hypothetical protein
MSRIAVGRRGVIYTIVSLFVLLIIGNIFFAESRITGKESSDATIDRVKSVNAFIVNFEHDSQRAAYIAGFRSFIAMEQYVTSSGLYLGNTPSTFREVFLNGTINGTQYDIMQNSSFNEYLARVSASAGQQGISLQATVVNVTLWQTDPWYVLVNYSIQMNVTDNRGTAQWQINRTMMGRVPIVDLRDPLFTSRTFGRIQRVIKMTNFTLFVNDTGNANDTTNFNRHFNSSLYRAAGRGPSMLMRFSGNLSDSPFGIESLVDVDEFTTQDLPVSSTASIVDYQYFNGVPATVCSIQNMPSKVKFDAASASIYEVTGKLTSSSC